jgi:hypothetical protein
MHHLPLFAQIAESSAEFESIGKTVFLVAMAAVGLVIPVVLLAWRKMHLAHIERMKAMELGQPLPPSFGPLALYCGVVGAGVPIGTFLITWLASQRLSAPNDLWVAPCAVSVVALIGVSIVAGVGFGRSVASADSQPKTKPTHDPDTVDFAGRLNGR